MFVFLFRIFPTSTEKPSLGIQTMVVEDEPQCGPGHSARVARRASQCVPDHNVDTKLTKASGARLKRQV